MKVRYWTESEIEYLRTHYGKESLEVLASRLKRTKRAVRARAKREGLTLRKCRRWTSKEIGLLRQNFGKVPIKEIAKMLGRTIPSIRARAKIERLTRGRPPDWTEAEIEFLKKNFGKLRDSEIARKLARTTKAVGIKASTLGLIRKTLAEQQAAELEPTEAAYIAGFIDGEGSLRFSIVWEGDTPIRAVPTLEISNQNRAILDWIAQRVVVSGRWRSRATYKKLEQRYRRKPYYHYHLAITGRARLKPALLAIFPYLRVKRPQAEAILEFIDTHETGIWTEHDWRLVLKVRELTASKKAPHIKQVERLRAWIETHFGTSSN